MINPIFANKYDEESFTEFIQGIIPCLSLDKKRSEVRTGFKSIKQIAEASENKLDLVVLVAKPDSSLHARVEITKNTYAVLKSHARSNALVVYISDDSSEWRLSLITTKVTRTKNGIKESISNPRRFSYVLGPNAKVATPSKMLQGVIDAINDLENKFSLAVVSKEFFTQIATQYSKLVGGTRGEGRRAVVFERTLKLGSTDDAVNANFAIRLIGRLVFCWFLKQKKGHIDNPLIPSEILSVSAVKTIGDYYHSICAPLFFEVLNKPQPSRPTFFSHADLFNKVPFLNGGLFQDHAEDNHKFNRTTGMSERRGVVSIPDIWFSELFQIFEEYNFTIDENTSIDTELSIDPEMLGRIFENLLAEVNPETGASARKSTGSFYTPREIVDFMVEESLIAHLKTKTNISEEKLRTLSSYDLDDDASHPIDQQERKLLVEAIHKTTVLDPACGSGAFPIGILQRLVHMLGVLDPECSIYLNNIPPEVRRQLQKQSLSYVRKLGVIRECIHGVDIQPIAIDISRLRCFLTLVVDQQVDDNAQNRGIEPLPNLDFKFVCANTLIKPPVHRGPLFGDEFADALGELIDEYFAPVDQLHKLETARKLQQLISDKTKKELENILKSYSYVKDEKYKKALAQKNEKSDAERMRINNLWGSYENIFQNKPVGFFDTRYFFPTVFRNGGFDIVIANPPYIGYKGHKSIFDEIKKTEFGRLYYNKEMDIFYYFVHRGLDLINENGYLSYITTRYWFTADGAKKLRSDVINRTSIEQIVDFGEHIIFEGAKGQHSCIFILEKNNTNKNTTKTKVIDFTDNNLNIISALRDDVCINENTKMLYENEIVDKLSGHLIFKNNNSAIINKIESVHGRLVDYCNLSSGIKTGADRIFVFDIENNEKFEQLNLNKDEDKQYFKDYYKNSNIKPYSISQFSKKLLLVKSKKDLENSKIRNYLQKNKNILFSRKARFGLMKNRLDLNQEENFLKIFEQGELKIVSPYRAKSASFALTCNEFYSAEDAYFITTRENCDISPKCLLAILNSKLINYWYFYKGKRKGKMLEFTVSPLKRIPIAEPSPDDQKLIIEIVDKILAITKSGDYLENPAKKEEVKEYEKQIDQLVYKLYGLTPEEIKIVEDSNV